MAESGDLGGSGIADVAVLDTLSRVVKDRANASPDKSYTAQLLDAGTVQIARKLGEEALETVLAATTGTREDVLRESADLLYHLLVLWEACDVAPGEVWGELSGRAGVSGLDEKAARDG